MKVICVDSKASDGALTRLQIYNVISNVDDFCLEGVKLSWSRIRFEILYPFKVKCIDDSGTSILVKDYIYNVIDSSNYTEFIIEGLSSNTWRSNTWRSNRFEILPETLEPKVVMVKSRSDIQDWKTWRGAPAPGYCHCGCNIELCIYHRA